MRLIILVIFVSLFLQPAYSDECRSGFKRPSYKTRQFYCNTGQMVADAYNPGVKILCEDMEVDHFIPLILGWCAGLSDEKMKSLANDPRNLKLTHRSTNRSKGGKEPLNFFRELKSTKLKDQLLLEAIEIKKDYGIKLNSNEIDEWLLTTKRLVTTNKQLLAGTKIRKIMLGGKLTPLEEAIETTSKNVAKRAAVGTARNITSMPAQRIPLLGLGVMIGVTGWDITDACKTTTELDILNKAINPQTSLDLEVEKICGLTIPTADEVVNFAKTSPKEAWENAKGFVPDMDNLSKVDIKNIDWGNHWESSKETGSSLVIGTKEKAQELTNKFKSWMKKE